MSERDKRLKLLADRYINSLSNKTIYLDADQFSDLADYFFEQGDIDTTFTCLEDGLTIHPDNDQLKIKKIKVLAAEGSYDEASYLMMDVSQQYDFELYFAKLQCMLPTMQNGETNAIEAKIISEETDQLDNVLIDIAYLYIENDNFRKAIDLFQTSKDWGKFSEDISEFAFCYEMIGEYDKAINIYLTLIDRDAYSASSWLSLGRLYALKEDYSKSVDALDFSLLNERDYNAMNLKANCLILLDRTEEAIDIYKEILDLEPENTDTLLKLFDCYSIQEDQNEANKFLEDYKDKSGKDEEYYLRKINSLLAINDIHEAQNMLSEVLLSPDCSLRIVLLHIDILISHNLYNEAYDYLITNKESIDQDDEEVIDRMSFLCIHLNKKELALEYTLKLLLIDGNNKKYKHRLALFLMEEYDYATLEAYLPIYTDEELSELVYLFFKLTEEEANDRDVLIVTIKNIIENRTLYKSLKY